LTAVESDFTDEELGLIEAEMERMEEEIRNGRPPEGYQQDSCKEDSTKGEGNRK